MPVFYMDASALVKRYAREIGTPLLNHLFSQVALEHFKILGIGIAELVAALTRKRNSGKLTSAAFAQAMIDVGAEIVNPSIVEKLNSDEAAIKDALPLIPRYSLNGTDAIILRTALNLAAILRTNANNLILVSSDQRLLKAAQAEGLVTFDPEVQTQAELDTLIGP